MNGLVALHSPTGEPEPEMTTNISAHTTIMWRLLDFASLQRSQTGQSLFQASWEGTLRTRASSREQVALEDPEISSPPGDLQTSTGNYAAPPDWFSPLTHSSPGAARQQQGLPAAGNQSQIDVAGTQHVSLQQGYTGPLTWAWGAGDPNVALDPWTQLYDRTGPEPGWWNYGNL